MRAQHFQKAGLRVETSTPSRPRPTLLVERTSPAWAQPAANAVYLRFGRPLLRGVLLMLVLPPALVLAAPIALVNALLFGGLEHVLFRQQRRGRDGSVFWILKFRTMRDVASPDAHDGPLHEPHDAARVTRCGRFLRNTHLDELPQLWNILRGEMDFIGPRPEMLALDEWACARIPGFRARNRVLPGLTGLAQITQGYAEQDERQYRAKLALDRHYIESISLVLDLKILARTALWMLRARGWRPRTARTSRAPESQ